MRTPAETGLVAAFEAAKARCRARPELRASEAFRLFPTAACRIAGVEEFKYTDLRALVREAAPLAREALRRPRPPRRRAPTPSPG